MPASVLNAAFYHFSPVADPGAFASRARTELKRLGVRGTLIVAKEGLNGFLAGSAEAVRGAVAFLRGQEAFGALTAKESVSGAMPFGKLTVKVKPEIVTFRTAAEVTAAPRLSPAELDQWIAEGREFALVDTRNEYEVRLGTFRGAESLNIDKFVDLPAAAAPRLEAWKGKPVVTFCTGGIRCEKAAPYLRAQGVDAYQLDGGILKHLEETGGTNWEGACFVFDERIAVGADLLPSGAFLCRACQWPNPAGQTACWHCAKELV